MDHSSFNYQLRDQMSKENPSIEHWQPCPSGELASLVEQQKSAKKKARISLYARSATAVVILISVTTAYLMTREHHYAGISCTEVQKNAQAYKKQTLQPEMIARIDQHLEKCSHCKQLFAQITKKHPEKTKSEVMLALASKVDLKNEPSQSSVGLLESVPLPTDRVSWQRHQWKQIRRQLAQKN